MKPSPRVFLGFWYYLPAVHRGVVRFAREAGWELRTNANDLAVPAGESFAGLILQYGVSPGLDAMADANPAHTVDFTRCAPTAKLHRVYVDGVAAGIMAAEYLLGLGPRQFVLVRGGHWGDDAKCQGFVDTLAAAGCPCEVWAVDAHSLARAQPEGTPADLATRLREKLAALRGPAGIFCLHDSYGDTLLREARDLGIAVPARLAVLGCGDDALLCEGTAPALSSIDVNLETVGYEAARRLDAVLRGMAGAPRETAVPPVRIVVRGSTGARDVGQPLVRRALEILDRTPDAEPAVDELARLVGVNRRALERAFKIDFGCGPLEVMIRRRVEHAVRLMRENPKLAGPVIAEKLGYESVSHFYRQFEKVKGLSVGEFRRRFTTPGG